MKIFFDTEFIEDGKTIDLLSIGAIREDGAVFYAESEEADHSKASEWVRANVLPHLLGGVARHPRRMIADTFRRFCGAQPEFWAYYADYDWVVLCQLYGRMVDLPDTWPMFCRDVKQLCIERGNPKLPKREGPEHHALQDARGVKEAWEFLSARPEVACSGETPRTDALMASKPGLWREWKDSDFHALSQHAGQMERLAKRWQKIADQRAIEVADLKTSAPSPRGTIITRECEKCGGELLVAPRVYDAPQPQRDADK